MHHHPIGNAPRVNQNLTPRAQRAPRKVHTTADAAAATEASEFEMGEVHSRERLDSADCTPDEKQGLTDVSPSSSYDDDPAAAKQRERWAACYATGRII